MFKKNATYKELFEALEAIVRHTQCADMLKPTHGQVPIKHLARAARIIEGAKGPIADKRIIDHCVEIETERAVIMIPRSEQPQPHIYPSSPPKRATSTKGLEKLPKVRAARKREIV